MEQLQSTPARSHAPPLRPDTANDQYGTVHEVAPDLCQEPWPPPSLFLCPASFLVKYLFHYMSMDQKPFPDCNPPAGDHRQRYITKTVSCESGH